MTLLRAGERLRTALVTGACSGIGHALARRLGSLGYDLALVSHRREALDAAAGAIAAEHGVRTVALPFDLARADAARELVGRLSEVGFEIDILINNAGVFFFGEAADADPEAARRMLELHVVTPSLLVTHLAPRMRERRAGHVLIVSSISAFQDFPGISYYGASKKYLLGFSRAVRSELGVYGVGVTCLAPGPVATALYDAKGVPVELARRLGVMASPDDVAERGLEAMFRGDEVCVPGIGWRAATLASRALPRAAIDAFRRRAPWLGAPGRPKR